VSMRVSCNFSRTGRPSLSLLLSLRAGEAVAVAVSSMWGGAPDSCGSSGRVMGASGAGRASRRRSRQRQRQRQAEKQNAAGVRGEPPIQAADGQDTWGGRRGCRREVQHSLSDTRFGQCARPSLSLWCARPTTTKKGERGRAGELASRVVHHKAQPMVIAGTKQQRARSTVTKTTIAFPDCASLTRLTRLISKSEARQTHHANPPS
jgi:hypothetical protein